MALEMTDPEEALELDEAYSLLRDLQEILWTRQAATPSGGSTLEIVDDEDAEHGADTLDRVARVLRDAGLGPTDPESRLAPGSSDPAEAFKVDW